MGVVLANMQDETIRNHLILHSRKCKTYQKCREEVRDILRAREAAGTTPTMEDELHREAKGKKGESRDDGKGSETSDLGKGNQYQGGKGRYGQNGNPHSAKVCYYCDKTGHVKSQCRSRENDMKEAAKRGAPLIERKKKVAITDDNDNAADSGRAPGPAASVLCTPQASVQEWTETRGRLVFAVH